MPMPDNLRTRIAAALRPHCDLGQQCACGWKWATAARFDVEQYDLHMADVVTDLLIDMAGHGELLKAIDRMYR